MKKRISITISEDLFDSFRTYCKDNGMKVSSKIEIILKEALNNSPEKILERVNRKEK